MATRAIGAAKSPSNTGLGNTIIDRSARSPNAPNVIAVTQCLPLPVSKPHEEGALAYCAVGLDIRELEEDKHHPVYGKERSGGKDNEISKVTRLQLVAERWNQKRHHQGDNELAEAGTREPQGRPRRPYAHKPQGEDHQ